MFLPEVITVLRDGAKGRPSANIRADFLEEALSSNRNICLQELANLMNIHRNTLRRHMKRHNIMRQYSAISDQDLDILVRTFKERKPESGLHYLIGFLRTHGLWVQRQRVRSSLRRVDGLNQLLRRRKNIRHRKYSVKRPNALWHLDGHHKMIRWGIVIHGFVDGYSRMVGLILFFTDAIKQILKFLY